MIRELRECPEIGTGQVSAVDVGLPAAVLAHRFDASTGTLLLIHNLDEVQVTVDLSSAVQAGDTPSEVFADKDYPPVDAKLHRVELGPFGYRWVRLSRRIGM